MNFIPAGQKQEVDGNTGPRLSSTQAEHSRIKTEDETEAAVSDSMKTEDDMPTLDAPVTAVAANLDTRIAELAARYLPLAKEMLAEAIRIPADYVDKPLDQGGDPLCGLVQPRVPPPRVPPQEDHRDQGGAEARRRLLRRLRQPGLVGRGPERRHRAGEEEGHLHRRPHRHRQGPPLPVEGEGRRRRLLRRSDRQGRRSTRTSSTRSWAGFRPSPSGSTSSSAAAPRTSSAA